MYILKNGPADREKIMQLAITTGKSLLFNILLPKEKKT